MKIEALTKISYGLFIVSTISDNKKNGYISNTVMQISNDPLIIAASCSKNNHSLKLIESSGIFTVSMLHQDASPELIGNFGFQTGKEVDKFKKINHKTATTGAPYVTDDAIAFLDCKVMEKIDASTHYVFLAEVVDADIMDETKKPMTYQYYREVKKGVIPQNSPTYIKDKEQKTTDTNKSDTPKYQCAVCGYIYDPENGDKENDIKPGTPFSELPDDWACPVCGAEKENFYQI